MDDLLCETMLTSLTYSFNIADGIESVGND